MLRIGNIVWGTRDIHRSMEFWMSALDYVPRDDIAADPVVDWVTLIPRSGSGPQFALMLVGSDGPKRHHLDLYAESESEEVDRLVALGATRVEDWNYEEGADYVVLADPDGNTFCVIEKPSDVLDALWSPRA